LDDNQLGLYVYKVRKPDNKLHFKFDLHEHSKVVSSNVKGEFRFCVDGDKIALFDGKSSEDRDNWEHIISASISNLRSSSSSISALPISSDPSLPLSFSSSSSSQTVVTQDNSYKPSSESQGFLEELQINVYQSAPPSTGRKYVPKENPLYSCPLIESVPFRRDPRVKASNSVDSKHQSLALGSIASKDLLDGVGCMEDKENSFNFSSYSPSIVHRRGDVPQSSPIAAQKNMKARNDNHDLQPIITNSGFELQTIIPEVQHAITEGVSDLESNNIVHYAVHPKDNPDESTECGEESTTVDGRSGQSTIDVVFLDQELIASSDTAPLDSSSSGGVTGTETNQREVALLKQEMEALSAMNDQLNDALESAESMMRSREDEHEYQLSFISRLLEQAQEESMQAKATLKEYIEQMEETVRSADELGQRLEAVQTELNNKGNELHISAEMVALRDSELQSMQTLAEQQRKEFSALHDQLADEQRLRVTEKWDFDRQLDQLAATTQQMRSELDDYEQCLTSEVAARVALPETTDPSSLSIIRQLTGALKQAKKELFDVSLAEEAGKLTKARLERVIQEQKAYEEQLLRQIDNSHQVTIKLNEAACQIEAYKEDALRILRERETTQKESDRLQQHCQMIEMELLRQREGYEEKLERNEVEAVQWKDQIQQMTSAAAHSVIHHPGRSNRSL